MKIIKILLIPSVLLSSSPAFPQVGIGTATPDPSAALDVTSTEKGFLPPRMTTAERNAINGGAFVPGLMIYNTDKKCLEWYRGNTWQSACSHAPLGEDFTNGFENNTECQAKAISVTRCSSIAGATLNDDPATAEGIEYDWASANSYMTGGTTRALVEIGGQCWFARNANIAPSGPIADAPNTGLNTWTTGNPGDLGYWGYYNTSDGSGAGGWGTSEPADGEGILYQWSAAMNNATTERGQGVCPTGWHIPSDCEFKAMEHHLGMSITEQNAVESNRLSGTVGDKLAAFTLAGTNASGFTGLPAGRRTSSGTFGLREDGNGTTTDGADWWTSTAPGTNAFFRSIDSTKSGVERAALLKVNALSVRCLKN